MRKDNSILTIIIIILSLSIVGLIGYIAYDKLLSNNDNEVIETKKENNVVSENEIVIQNEELINQIKSVFKFAYEYFDEGNAYCGEEGTEGYIIGNKTPSNGFKGSKQFKSYQDMIDYLSNYMNEEVINKKNSIKKEFYVEQDGKLYCEDLGKGGNLYQLENIIYQINSLNNNILNATIAVELSTGDNTIENTYKDYENYNVIFTRSNDNWIITSYEKQK